MRNKPWIFPITSLYSVRLNNLWMDKIALESFISNSRKLSRQKFHNYLACEFTAYSACRNTEMNLKFTTTNGLNFRIINSLLESYAWSGLAVKCARNWIMTVLELAGWIDHLRLSVQPSCATMRRKWPPNLGILKSRLREFRPCVLSKTRVTFISKRRTHFVIYCSSLFTIWLSLHTDIIRASSRGLRDESKNVYVRGYI